jgi:hypothetical protein
MVQLVRSVRRFGGLLFALWLALLLPVSAPMLHAQAPGATGVESTVLDPDSKSVVNAAVVIRYDATGETRALVTDGKIENVAFTLSVAALTENVTVSADLPAAAQVAPSQGSLDARSAQSLISEQFIQNFTSPVADYTQVIQMAPGTFSLSPNGVGLGDSETFYRGFSDGYYNMTFDGIPFNDTNTPSHPLLGVLPRPVHRRHGVRPQPRIGGDGRSDDLRRLGESPVAQRGSAAGDQRHGVVRLVQHASARR